MSKHPSISSSSKSQQEAIALLEQEIAALEQELVAVEGQLNAFESQIRSQLRHQILQIQTLTALYKKQKQEKKAKRLEQKKRGKNYKEPKGIRKAVTEFAFSPQLDKNKLQQLKQLYKEAIVLVHPDKFANQANDITERANALTVQLNALYKNEDLEQLNYFHEHIISGNAMSHVSLKQETIADEHAMLKFLQRKRDSLQSELEKTRQSQTYEVLTTYEYPAKFIDELRQEFSLRILQLQKRTRKA